LDRGNAAAESETELLDKLLAELQDCGTAQHNWITKREVPDPNNADSILCTQRLECAYCDTRERVITISSPLPRGQMDLK
jgi:hypothetical protein